MAAQEQQDQRVVGLGSVRRGGWCGLEGGRSLPVGPCGLAPSLVDESPLGGPDEPCGGPLGHAVAGPVVRGGDERLLDGVLGRIEITTPPSDDAEDLRRKIAEQVLDGRRAAQARRPDVAVSSQSSIASGVLGAASMIRRTWMGCWMGTPSSPGTADSRAAISMARASDSTSKIW
jgi:hypothetical protein